MSIMKAKMVKILFIWNVSNPNANIGTYKPSVWVAKQNGYFIDIAMNFSKVSQRKKEEVEKQLGVRLIHIDIERNPSSIVNFRAYRQLVKLMKKEKYDIIHCNTPMGSILGRLAAFRTGNKKVFYMNRGFHFYEGAPKKNWLIIYPIEKFFARFFTDAIATINPIDYQYAQKFVLRKHSNLKYSLPGPGVELEQFTYCEDDRKRVRKELGIKEEDVVLISVGELSLRKNNSVIIEALGLIKNLQVYYILVGEGSMKDQLRKLARKNNIENNVIFLGMKDNPTPYYSASDIFVFPSLNEGFGRVGIEAMHVGLPIVTSNVQGINLYSDHGKTGFKYNPNDVAGFAEGISLLINDNGLREKISEYNRKKSERFALENTGKLISKIYKDLLEI